MVGPTYVYGDNKYVGGAQHSAPGVCSEEENQRNMLPCSAGVRHNGVINHWPCTVLSVNNPADICTKAVPGGQKRDHLIRLLLRYMTLLIEHLIILLFAEEVCGSLRFPGCMGSQIHNQMTDWVSYCGLKKGERSHARARMSARGSLG
jgi:hypothetical protein